MAPRTAEQRYKPATPKSWLASPDQIVDTFTTNAAIGNGHTNAMMTAAHGLIELRMVVSEVAPAIYTTQVPMRTGMLAITARNVAALSARLAPRTVRLNA